MAPAWSLVLQGVGGGGHSPSRMVPRAFVASRVELKGWASISLESAKQLVCMTKADLNLFDCDLTDSDQ